MGSKADYTKLIEDKQDLDKRIGEQITRKLNHLRAVGRSVMNKCYGGNSWTQEDLSFMGALGTFFTSSSEVKSFNETEIHLTSPSFMGKLPKGELVIARLHLHLSDRDFAKRVRELVRKRKDYLKRLRLANAKEELQQAEESLSKQLKKIQELKNLVEEFNGANQGS